MESLAAFSTRTGNGQQSQLRRIGNVTVLFPCDSDARIELVKSNRFLFGPQFKKFFLNNVQIPPKDRFLKRLFNLINFGKRRPMNETILSYYCLRGSMSDHCVVEEFEKEFGSKEKMETSLEELLCLIKMQANAERGPLLINGVNIFHVKIGNDLYVVNVFRKKGSWFLGAGPISYEGKWPRNSQLFTKG